MFSYLRNLCTVTVFSLLVGLSSCELINEVDEVVAPDKNKSDYVIKKGTHSSTTGIQNITGTSMRYEVTFDSSAVYSTTDPVNQADINKLFGASDCGSEHHTNSARFGWRWYNNQLEIHAYTYVNEKLSNKLISTVDLGKSYVYEIKFEENAYTFLLNGRQVTMPRNCGGAADGYMLYPYFGGDELAPHDISIKLNRLQ